MVRPLLADHSERNEEARARTYERRCLAVSDSRFFTPLRFVQNDSAWLAFSPMGCGADSQMPTLLNSLVTKDTDMSRQPLFAFDDPDSRTRDRGLDIVYAEAKGVERFSVSFFGGFTSMRALTYTPSIPMVLELLKDFDYEHFECIFGHNGILNRDAADILAFQSIVDEKLNKGFVGVKGLSDERRKIIYDRAASGTAQFYVVKDAIAHAKIYLLEREGLRRVIVGSANLSETAFSGRQAETLIAFDNDETAWEHYSTQYEVV